jgi:hypothetical protein
VLFSASFVQARPIAPLIPKLRSTILKNSGKGNPSSPTGIEALTLGLIVRRGRTGVKRRTDHFDKAIRHGATYGVGEADRCSPTSKKTRGLVRCQARGFVRSGMDTEPGENTVNGLVPPLWTGCVPRMWRSFVSTAVPPKQNSR